MGVREKEARYIGRRKQYSTWTHVDMSVRQSEGKHFLFSPTIELGKESGFWKHIVRSRKMRENATFCEPVGMVNKTFTGAGDKAAQQGAAVSHVDLSINIWTILCGGGGPMDILRYLTIYLTLINPQSFFPPRQV